MEDSEELKVNEEADEQKHNEDESEQEKKVCSKNCLGLHSNMLG
jgi:hypothetical protein